MTLVEISDITFEPMKDKGDSDARLMDDGEKLVIIPDGNLCFWLAVFNISKIV
jgi:hypothetical protein